MEETEVAEVADSSDAPLVESARHGQGLRMLVEARKGELELARLDASQSTPGRVANIDEALHALEGLLTGDLDNIQPVTAVQLNQWIKTSRNLTVDTRHGQASAEVEPALMAGETELEIEPPDPEPELHSVHP